MTATVRRDPTLWRWSVRDGLGANGKLVARSYRTELEGVFTRAGQKWVPDRNGMLVPCAHSVPPLATVGGEEVLLLEAASTNLVLRSQELGNAAWSSSGVTVTADAARAPDGTLTMDLLTAAATTSLLSQDVTFTGNGEKVFSCFVREFSSSALPQFLIYDNTAAADRHRVTLTWTAGIPSLSTIAGAGTLFSPVWYFNDGWRIAFSATGVIAANTNRVVIYPDRNIGTGAVYVWGVQAENQAAPSTYMPTAGATASRVADALYFPYLPAPQALTVYYRGIEVGLRVMALATATGAHLWTMTDATDANPRLRMNCLGSNGRYQFQRTLADGTQYTAASSSDAAQPSTGEVFESRGVLYAPGNLISGLQAASESVEATGADARTAALESAWSGQRLYFNQAGSGALRYQSAITELVVATGERSLAQMRALAGRA
jgi:hypothetical protein